MMEEKKFFIRGLGHQRTLRGEVFISGAKNAVLKIMAASLLFEDDLHIENIPKVEDVERMKELLIDLGAEIRQTGERSIKINTAGVKKTELHTEISQKMRASIVLSGAMLGRFGQVHFPHPGGCVIGERPISMFLNAYRGMGTEIERDEEGIYHLKAPEGLKAKATFLNKQSVGVTETLIMASILAKGRSVIKNAALEPEVVDVAGFLQKCGAKISGLGTTTITIEGGKPLKSGGKVYKVMPDRLEAGSFLVLGALASNDLLIKNCQPEHLEALTSILRFSGLRMEAGKDYIKVLNNEGAEFKPLEIKTHEYPGFPTDLQAPMAVFMTQVKGESSIFETIFENRFGYTEDLNKMGARIRLWHPQKISIEGPSRLKGGTLHGPDLRAGLAFIIAAILAQGDSVIENAYYVDRGYEAIEKKLQKIGVSIERAK